MSCYIRAAQVRLDDRSNNMFDYYQLLKIFVYSLYILLAALLVSPSHTVLPPIPASE